MLTDAQRADLYGDFLAFTEYMFRARRGSKYVTAEHHHEIAEALERVFIGKTKRLIINVPPRSGKTELAVKHWIAWCMGIVPDSEFIHASYSKRLATTNTFETRAIMQHEAWTDLFGPAGFRQDSNAKDEFRTIDGGVVYATGAEGTITGYGAGKMREGFGGAMIIDDPHKAGEAASDIKRDNVLEWFQVTMESRLNKRETPVILIMQRLHEMDLSGWLLAGGNGEEWDHIKIPAITPDGVSYWERQMPLDDLQRLERTNSYVFAGQYMQEPAPIGGGIFKDDWWRYYKIAPALEWRAIYVDTAQKTKQENDFTVFQCWGRSKEGRAVMLDQVRGKWEAPELLVQARAFWTKHKESHHAPLRAMKIEDKVSGTGLIQTLKREGGVPVVAIQRDKDKLTRALDTVAFIESGNVLLPEQAPWLSDFLAEASVFPNGVHDDQLDPAMDAITDICQQRAEVRVRGL